MTGRFAPRRRLTRLAAATTVAALALLLAACGGSDDGGDDGGAAAENTPAATKPVSELLPDAIAQRGELRIGVSPNFPPLNFENEDGETDGIERDLGEALAAELGLRYAQVETNFPGLLPGLAADRFDVVLSGMNDTKERQEQVDFVDYMESGSSVLVKSGNPEGIDGVDGLCGKIVGETVGTTYIEEVGEFSKACEQRGEEPIEVQTFPAGVEVAQALQTGRIHATFANHIANLYFADQTEGQLEAVGDRVNAAPLGIAITKTNDELVTAVQTAMQALMDNGTYERILTEWGVTDAGIDQATLNGATS
jgi:polar amino acid transport system substrate-binding protein